MTPEVSVIRHADAPAELFSLDWCHTASASAPARLRAAGADARWATSYLVVTCGRRAVGMLSLHSPRSDRLLDPDYDIRRVVPGCVGTAPEDPRKWTFVGGCRDLAAGPLHVRGLSPEERAEVTELLTARAFGEADYPVALYVRDADVGGFPGRHTELTTESTVWLPASGRAEFFAGISRSHRYVLRRDRRDLTTAGLRLVPSDVADVLTEAIPLILATKEKHGGREHPRLAALRVREWLGCGLGEYVAFAVRDSHARLVAVSLACRSGSAVEVYEVGMVPAACDRHTAYVAALVGGPLDFALEHGCRRVELGLDSPGPKARRGATVRPVWAVTR